MVGANRGTTLRPERIHGDYVFSVLKKGGTFRPDLDSMDSHVLLQFHSNASRPEPGFLFGDICCEDTLPHLLF